MPLSRVVLAVCACLVLLAASGAVSSEVPAPKRCELTRPSLPISEVEPVPGAHFGYVSDAGQMTSGFYCVDYLVINYHERNSLRFEWKGTPLHADPGAALAPGGHSKDSFVYAVSYYADPAHGPDDRELKYGRDLQHSFNAAAYAPPGSEKSVRTENHLGAHRFRVEATGETVDFDIVMQTAVDLTFKDYGTALHVKKVRGDVRLRWFPRTDVAFVMAAGASDLKTAYRLTPGTKKFEPLTILPNRDWRIVPLVAQVWIRDTPVLDALFPTIVVAER